MGTGNRMMGYWEDYKPEHIEHIKESPGYKRVISEYGEFSITGKAFTIHSNDGEICGIVGMVGVLPHVVEAYGFFNPNIKDKFSALAAIHVLIKYVIESYKLRRIQATVSTNNEAALRFAGWYGFSLEGEMKDYEGIGRNSYILGRYA